MSFTAFLKSRMLYVYVTITEVADTYLSDWRGTYLSQVYYLIDN